MKVKVLNGWKEIAECLHRTSRSARRWERLGLPVWRVSNSSRSAVMAYEHEIQVWIRHRRLTESSSLAANTARYRATQLETRQLVTDLRDARTRFKKQLDSLLIQIKRDHGASANISLQHPKRAS